MCFALNFKLLQQNLNSRLKLFKFLSNDINSKAHLVINLVLVLRYYSTLVGPVEKVTINTGGIANYRNIKTNLNLNYIQSMIHFINVLDIFQIMYLKMKIFKSFL